MPIHNYAFLEKDFVKFEDAKISVMTHAFLYGTAVFEGIRDSCFFIWNPDKQVLNLLQARPHLERLMNSCKILRMNPYYGVDEMLERIVELMKRNKPQTDAYIRPSWFKSSLRIGPSLLGKAAENEEDEAFVITSLDLGNYLDVNKGLRVNVSSWRRVSDNAIPPRAKINGSYVNTALAKANSTLAGYDDSIFLTEEGYVSEGSAMNLFLVKAGKLITPLGSDNILEGITRAFIIRLAKEELGLEVETRQINRTELYTADEAFFAGTGAQIAPIGSVDDYVLGNGQIGEITQKLQGIHKTVCLGENEKYADQLVKVEYSTQTA